MTQQMTVAEMLKLTLLVIVAVLAFSALVGSIVDRWREEHRRREAEAEVDEYRAALSACMEPLPEIEGEREAESARRRERVNAAVLAMLRGGQDE